MSKKSTAELSYIGSYQDKHSATIESCSTRFEEALKLHEKFVKKAEKNENFVFGEQWSEEDRKNNEDNGKPVLTINISLSTINAIYTEYSKIRADITTKSTGKAVHDESVLLNKTIRNVMYQNNYSEQEADFFIDGITSGRGWFSIELSDKKDPLGAIDIKVDDYNRIVMSPDAADYDPDTWPELFYFEEHTREELEELFGKDKVEMLQYSEDDDLKAYSYLKDLRTFGEGTQDAENNGGRKYDKFPVITREFYEYTDAYTFVDDSTTDYEIVPSDSFTNDEEATTLAKENNLSLYKSRMQRIRYVQWCGSILLTDEWLPYKHFTKYPFFAYFSKGRTMSVMDNIVSPQEQLNKAESQELHIVNSTSNGGWQMEEDTLVNMTPEQLEKKGSKAGLVIVRRRGAKPLEKIHPNQVPTGISNLGNKAGVHLMRVAGVNEGMLGITKTNDSGTLLEGKKDAGQGLLQRVFDNLRRSQKYITRGVIDIIQEYYTEPRILRYTAVDGEVTEEVAINQVDAANRIINDVTVGRYEVVVTWSPKADVLNDYELDQYIRMREAGIQVPDYIIVEKSQLSNKQELVAILRRAAGLDKTPEEQQLESVLQQIQIAEQQLKLQELQSKINVNNARAAEHQANAQDIIIGQNKRHILDIMANRESDQLNAGLRATLADVSAESSITKTMLQNSAKAKEPTPKLGETEE